MPGSAICHCLHSSCNEIQAAYDIANKFLDWLHV